MRRNDPSETLITILQSTSFLLQHYGNSVHEPTLSELQHLISIAVTQFKAHVHTGLGAQNSSGTQ